MRDARMRVAIVVGGESGEYDISLMSGREVLRHLDQTRWAVRVVRIERDGAWCLPKRAEVDGLAERVGVGDGINALLAWEPDVVFPVMHGPYGEDGRFQSLLELLHLPYVGSRPDAAALAMNKARTRDVYAQAGLRVARAEEIGSGQTPTLSPPCVVKPMRMGSSVGLSIARDLEELAQALKAGFEHDDTLLIEEYVAGRELTAGVIEDASGGLIALPIIEIRPKTSFFFDLHAKYTPGATDEICPAPIDDALRDEAQRIGLLAHRVLGCRHMSRTDLIVDEAGACIVLETNTIPGMTETSLLPQAAAVAGYSYPALLDLLLERALATLPPDP